jgi:DNA invertase Pin-like site-specific DNA recombinase
MKEYAYARVSTKEQNLDRQLKCFLELGISKKDIFCEAITGATFERTEYSRLVKKLKEGDTLFIKSIDRLGRNYKEILEQWKILINQKKINIVVIDMPLLDTRYKQDLIGTFVSDIVLQLLAYVAEQERTFIKQRQAEGILAAKKRGVRFGRPELQISNDYLDMLNLYLNKEISVKEASLKLGMTERQFRYRMNLVDNK